MKTYLITFYLTRELITLFLASLYLNDAFFEDYAYDL